jgi:hypothetical protein
MWQFDFILHRPQRMGPFHQETGGGDSVNDYKSALHLYNREVLVMPKTHTVQNRIIYFYLK